MAPSSSVPHFPVCVEEPSDSVRMKSKRIKSRKEKAKAEIKDNNE